MHLYIEPMDATLVDFTPDGRVKLDDEDWSKPSLQETRAIIYAAEKEKNNLEDLIAALESRHD